MEDNEIIPPEEVVVRDKRGWRIVRGDKDCIPYTWQEFLDHYRCPRIAHAIWRKSVILAVEEKEGFSSEGVSRSKTEFFDPQEKKWLGIHSSPAAVQHMS